MQIVFPRYGRFFRYHERGVTSGHAPNMAEDRIPVKNLDGGTFCVVQN
jgi:hypothetical protein